MHFYDMEIIDEDIFLKWKEEVNDEYPGKGKALFQVKFYIIHVYIVDMHNKTEIHTPSLEFDLKRLNFILLIKIVNKNIPKNKRLRKVKYGQCLVQSV